MARLSDIFRGQFPCTQHSVSLEYFLWPHLSLPTLPKTLTLLEATAKMLFQGQFSQSPSLSLAAGGNLKSSCPDLTHPWWSTVTVQSQS